MKLETCHSVYNFSPVCTRSKHPDSLQSIALCKWEGFLGTTHLSAMCQAVFVELYTNKFHIKSKLETTVDKMFLVFRYSRL
jgi:hypothetical protein